VLNIDQLEIQYVTNVVGEKTGVILSMQRLQDLLEDIEQLAAIAERREEPTIPYEQLLATLKENGLL
jgi:hypothetical protein